MKRAANDRGPHWGPLTAMNARRVVKGRQTPQTQRESFRNLRGSAIGRFGNFRLIQLIDASY